MTRLVGQPNVRPPVEANDEDLLLKQAQAGELGAFERVVELHRDRVYGLALRMTRSEADAASQLASTTSGVSRVVRLFEYLD